MEELKDLEGVGRAAIEKLNAAGIFDVIGLAVKSPSDLVEIIGGSEATNRKLIQKAREMLSFSFETGKDIDKRRTEMIKIPTGCKPIDDMMGGGFETGSITEIYGDWGSGKTQLAHFLCCKVQQQIPGSLVYYLDTETTFRPERIRDFCEGLGLDPEKILKNIIYAKAFNFEHQILLAEEIEKQIAKDKLNVKLIVVDSLTAHARSEMTGRGTLAERQQLLNKHMHKLGKIGDIYNCCVLATNQVMSSPGVSFGNPIQPIGGNIVGHNSTSRIYIRKGKADSRVVKLVDSPHLPISDANFNITRTGLEMVDEK
jgi:DNA repair protein RadA